jgi:elongation factor G
MAGKTYATDKLRNVVLLGHGGAGKTTLVEAMLFDTGAVNRLGKVDDGTSVSDWDEEERRRGLSINTSIVPCEWRNHKLNVLDSPGYMDFVGEVASAVRVADGAIVVLDSVGGVEVGTAQVWASADARNLPRLAFINKMERENASFDRIVAELGDEFGILALPIQLPIGNQAHFQGVVDLISGKAYLGNTETAGEVPADLADAVEEARLTLLEAAAEGEDALMEKYFEEEALSDEEIARGLRNRIRRGEVLPVLCGSAAMNIGVRRLMKAIIDYLPAPGTEPATNPATGEDMELSPDELGPLAVLAFKTVADPYVGKLSYLRVYSGRLESDSRIYNFRAGEEERLGQLYFMRGKEQIPTDVVTAGDIGAVTKLSETETGDVLGDRGAPVHLAPPTFPNPLFSVAVSPRTKADAAKVTPTLTRLCEQDPTLRWYNEPSTRQMILSGMGDTHINVAVRRMEDTFGLGVDTALPKVPYRETITRSVTAQYRHKKQTGGAGQFAEVHARIEPLERDAGYEFKWEVVGMNVSKTFGPSIDKGVRSVMEQGVIAGYPVVDFLFAVYDGKEHPVDSKDIAFQIAGREVFKLAVRNASPVLLEPIYRFTITVPEEYMGDVLSDLNTKRAQVLGMDQQGGKSIVTALAPLAEMQRYTTDLRSITQGRGVFEMEFVDYQQVPAYLQQELIEETKREAEEDK